MKKIVALSIFVLAISFSASAQVQSQKRSTAAKQDKRELAQVLKSKKNKQKFQEIKQQARKQD